MPNIIGGYFTRFAKMDKIYKKMCFQSVEDYRFTPNEVVVLMFLSNNPGLDTASDIARFRGLSKGLIARSVESLSTAGYLTAQKDRDDRRIIHLHLTEKSGPVTDRLKACRREFLRRLEEGIPGDYLDQLEATLALMEKNLDRMTDGGI